MVIYGLLLAIINLLSIAFGPKAVLRDRMALATAASVSGSLALLFWLVVPLSLSLGLGLVAVATLGVAMAVIDLAEKRLPLFLTLFLLFEMLVITVVFSVLRNWFALWGALGGLVVFVSLLTLGNLRGQLGRGDILLGASLGIWIGTTAATPSDPFWGGLQWSAAALLLSMIFGLVFAALRGTGRKDRFPLGPALILGAVTVVIGPLTFLF